MLTKDLVRAIAEITGGTQKDAKMHLDATLEAIVRGLREEGSVELKGFGKFVTKEVEERTAKNPKTGEDVLVPAHRKVSAKLSPAVKAQVNA